MKITIISHAIYPHISPRSFRTTELAKGLAQLGHEVVVYALTGTYDYTQYQKENGITVRSLGVSRLNTNSDGLRNVKRGFISQKINGVLFKLLNPLIDYPRSEFISLTQELLKKIEPCDYLITIAHPYGIHWGAALFNKKYPHTKFKIWVSDCGDPFMGDKDVKRCKLILGRLEKLWGDQTDAIVIPVEKGRLGYAKEVQNKIAIIPQSIDFSAVRLAAYVPNKVPTFLYCGAVYPGMRDPTALLEYLSDIKDDFRFVVYSQSELFNRFKPVLGDKLDIRAKINRLDLIEIQSQMDFLVNIKNDSDNQTPSKLIDYGLSKRPVLDISTVFTEFEKDNLNSFLHGDYSKQRVIGNLEQYDNKNVAKQFVQLYEKLIDSEHE